MQTPLRSSARAGFTLIEMMVVIAIIGLLTGLGVAAFKGGANGDGTRGAANAASSAFNQARTEAIMRREPAAVIIDTSNPADTAHYLRRMMVIYLVETPAAAGAAANVPTTTWAQGSPWIMLPGNNYFDPAYSSPFGTLPLTLTAATGSYAYYAYDPTGQAYSLPVTLPDGATVQGPPVSEANQPTPPEGQFVVSPGHLNGNAFVERDTHSRYGFILFPLGRIAFIQDVINDMNPPGTSTAPGTFWSTP